VAELTRPYCPRRGSDGCAHARCEARGQWAEAVTRWLETIDRDPGDFYSMPGNAPHLWP
jgi:hypothetical protein